MKEKLNRILVSQKGKSTEYRVDEILFENGRRAIRDYMVHPGAVAVLAIYKGRFILVRQFRYPVKSETYEIPAGKLEKGENPLDCAARELEEETGFRAEKISPLLSFYPTSAFSTEIIHIFYAENLIKKKARPDDDEHIRTVLIQEKTLQKMIAKGRIKDSKTILAFLYFKKTGTVPIRS